MTRTVAAPILGLILFANGRALVTFHFHYKGLRIELDARTGPLLFMRSFWDSKMSRTPLFWKFSARLALAAYGIRPI